MLQKCVTKQCRGIDLLVIMLHLAGFSFFYGCTRTIQEQYSCIVLDKLDTVQICLRESVCYHVTICKLTEHQASLLVFIFF